MKKVLLIVTAIFVCILLWSVYTKKQPETFVPVAVKDSFQLNYSQATQAEWQNCDRVYKVKFFLNGERKEVAFLFTGALIRSKE